MTNEERREIEEHTRLRILRGRGIMHPDDVCQACRGLGWRAYSSGATWRGGMGTASIEWDCCDKCWGSGDTSRPGADLRKLEAEEKERVERRARELFAEACCSTWATMAPARRFIREALGALMRRRKLPDGVDWMTLDPICNGLIRLLEDQK